MRRAALLLLPLVFACETETQFYPTPSDRVAEAVISGQDLSARSLVDGWRQSDVLDAPLGATRVAALVRLTGPDAEAPLIEARGVDEDGEEGDWQPLETTWEEEGQFVARVDLEFASVAAQIRVRSGDDVDHILWSALVPEPQPLDPIEVPVGSVSQALRTELEGLVVPRSEWGARSTRCTFRDESKTRMAVHHTVTAAMGEPTALLRGIQSFHMDGRGWCDVGYHFLVTIDGTVWEARPVEFLGAHVLNHNTGNIGVSFVGCYESTHPDCAPLPPNVPPMEMIQGAARTMGRLSELYDIPLTADRVMGHRDHVGASTVCPGNDLHAMLGTLRNDASSGGSRYGAAYVDQSFPLASQEFVLLPGEERTGYIEMRNTGTETWRPDETFLATTEPRLGDSVLAADDWVAPSRPTGVDRVVAPGETGRFEFTLRAPYEAGEYDQFFGLFQWGVAWFSDEGEGGPPDDQLQVRVTVTMDGIPPDAGLADAGMDGAAGAMDAGMDAGSRIDPPDEGCGCRVAGASSGPSHLWWCALVAVVAVRRRRRR